MFSKATLKTDLALAAPMIVGIFAYFNVHLNANVVIQFTNQIVDALFVIVPAILFVYHSVAHARITAAASAPLTTALLTAPAPVAPPPDPAPPTAPASAI